MLIRIRIILYGKQRASGSLRRQNNRVALTAMNAPDDTETSVSDQIDDTDESQSNSNNDGLPAHAYDGPADTGWQADEQTDEAPPYPSGTPADDFGVDGQSAADHPLKPAADAMRDYVGGILDADATPDADTVARTIAEDHDATSEDVLVLIERSYNIDDDGKIEGEYTNLESTMASVDEGTPPTWDTLKQMFRLTAKDMPVNIGGKDIKSTGEANKRAQFLCAARLEYEHDWAYFKDENYGLDTFRWYNPDTGMYERGGDDAVFGLLDEHIKEFASSFEASEIVKKLKVRNEVDRDVANAGGSNKVLLKNGVLNTNTWGLNETSPEHYFTRQLGARWDPDVDTTEVREFLESIVGKDHHVDVLCEMAGDTLSPDYTREWFAALYGTGANGKSKFLRLIRETLGSGNVAAQKIADIIEGEYAMGHIAGGFGTLANLIPEVDVRKVENANPIKELTSGDAVGMRDIYGDPYEGENTSKLFVATNEPMIFTERTNAIIRRIKPLKLPYEFKLPGDYNDDNPRHKHADIDLEEWLYTADNLAAFLQLMAEGLQRLRDDGGFSYERSQQELYDEYQLAADPFFAWWSSCLENHRGDWTDTETPLYLENDQIYSMYKSAMDTQNEKAMKERSFWSEFNSITGLELEKYRPSRADGRTRKYIVPTDEGFHYLNTSGLKDFEVHSDIEIPDDVRSDDDDDDDDDDNDNNGVKVEGLSGHGDVQENDENDGVGDLQKVMRVMPEAEMADGGGTSVASIAGETGLSPDRARDAICDLLFDGNVERTNGKFHKAVSAKPGDTQ